MTTQAPTPAPSQGLSPERLDQVIATTKPQGWIALVTVIVLILATAIWSIVATIPQQSSALGVVSSLAYTETVTAPASGAFNLAAVEPGGTVTKGEVLGTITPYDGSGNVQVMAPASGTIARIAVDNGDGVVPGDQLAVVQIPPDPSKGIGVVTYLSAADAMTFTPGETASVMVTNLAQDLSAQAEATVMSVASTPATAESMAVQAGSEATVEEWERQAGGNAYRVMLSITSASAIPAELVPQAGQPLQIVNTYGTIHPIELLFGAR